MDFVYTRGACQAARARSLTGRPRIQPGRTILAANANFLALFGYTAAEIIGRKHKLFVDAVHAASQEYRDFGNDLSKAHFKRAEFKRLAKGGREVYIQATYNPLIGRDWQGVQNHQICYDITEMLRNIEFAGQIEALHRS